MVVEFEREKPSTVFIDRRLVTSLFLIINRPWPQPGTPSHFYFAPQQPLLPTGLHHQRKVSLLCCATVLVLYVCDCTTVTVREKPAPRNLAWQVRQWPFTESAEHQRFTYPLINCHIFFTCVSSPTLSRYTTGRHDIVYRVVDFPPLLRATK